MSLFWLKPLSGFLWLSVRAFSWPLPALPPLLWPPGPFLIPEEALACPTLASPSAWSPLPGSLSHRCILTPDDASLVGPPQPLSLPSPCLLPSHCLASLVAFYCLSPLFGKELHKLQTRLSGALPWPQ